MKPQPKTQAIVAPVQADGWRYVRCPHCGDTHRHDEGTGWRRAPCDTDPDGPDLEYIVCANEVQRQIALLRVRRDSPSEDFVWDVLRDRHTPSDPAALVAYVEGLPYACNEARKQARRFAKRLMTTPASG